MSTPSAVRSMTGYARVRRQAPDGELALSIRAVNHRGLDLHFHLGIELEPLEGALRGLIARHVTRGHLDVRARLDRAGAGAPVWNRALMRSYVEAVREASVEFGLREEPSLNAAFRIPGMLGDNDAEPAGGFEEALLAAAADALVSLVAHREREGAAIVAEVRAHNAAILETAREIERLRAEIQPHLQARLEQKLAGLLQTSLEPPRLAQEAALLADRSDIAEETARLRIHAAELDALLSAGGEIGKKLEFMAQEMHREAGTILSKSGGAGTPGLPVTALALRAKSGIEKIREQALNLE